MAKEDVIDFRVVIKGDNAKLVREGLDKMCEDEIRKTYQDAASAVIVQHFKKKINSEQKPERSVATKLNRK